MRGSGISVLPLAAAMLVAGAAQAQGSAPDVVSLSPVDREAALEAGARHGAAEPPINGLSRGVHGEIGTSLDSRGGHALFGTARVPLGESGAASFSFLTAGRDWHQH